MNIKNIEKNECLVLLNMLINDLWDESDATKRRTRNLVLELSRIKKSKDIDKLNKEQKNELDVLIDSICKMFGEL